MERNVVCTVTRPFRIFFWRAKGVACKTRQRQETMNLVTVAYKLQDGCELNIKNAIAYMVVTVASNFGLFNLPFVSYVEIHFLHRRLLAYPPTTVDHTLLSDMRTRFLPPQPRAHFSISVRVRKLASVEGAVVSILFFFQQCIQLESRQFRRCLVCWSGSFVSIRYNKAISQLLCQLSLTYSY